MLVVHETRALNVPHLKRWKLYINFLDHIQTHKNRTGTFFPVNITAFEAKEAAEKFKNAVGELGTFNTLALILYFHFCDYPLINFN